MMVTWEDVAVNSLSEKETPPLWRGVAGIHIANRMPEGKLEFGTVPACQPDR